MSIFGMSNTGVKVVDESNARAADCPNKQEASVIPITSRIFRHLYGILALPPSPSKI
jgi:hypothetical protein